MPNLRRRAWTYSSLDENEGYHRAPMKAARLSCFLIGSLLAACAWDPFIPGENSWNPPVVVDSANLSHRLALDSPYVDTLDCYSRECQQRFRLIIEESGQLTVTAMLDLASQDEQGRMVLEAITGVIARASTGRGVRTDAAPLTIREPVERGVYFVLLQSIGGRVPYEITATLTPGPVESPEPYVAEGLPPGPSRALPPGPGPPMRQLSKIRLPGQAKGRYDSQVIFTGHETFSFPRNARPGDGAPPGTPVEQPGDRQIRRQITNNLEMKGFRQAQGDEASDLFVTFSTSQGSRTWFFSYYGFQPMTGTSPLLSPWEYETGSLAIDVYTPRKEVAYSASVVRGMGPGITPGEKTAQLVREAVTQLLTGFPPH